MENTRKKRKSQNLGHQQSWQSERKKRYYKKHPEQSLKEARVYRERNREKINKKRRERNCKPNFKLNNRIRVAIWQAIKYKKCGRHWEDLVGYTLEDIISYFKIKFNFDIEIQLNKNVHIDHIIPEHLFKFSSYEDKEFKKCWSLRNLRPISSKENLHKQAKLDMNLVEEYKIFDLLPSV